MHLTVISWSLFRQSLLLLVATGATLSSHVHFVSIDDLPIHQKNLFYFFTGGISHTIWNNGSIISHISEKEVSSQCRNSLIRISDALDQGSEWAFRFVDAGSKSPSGLLDGTLSSYGDYDQCLEITDRDFVGKYCVIELKHEVKNDALEIDQLISQSVPSFRDVNLNQGICFPSTCSDHEILNIVRNRISTAFPFKVLDDITCETSETTTWQAKMKDLTTSQRVASTIIIAVFIGVTNGTIAHLFDLISRHFSINVREYIPAPMVFDLLCNFSIAKSVVTLVTVKKEERFVTFAEFTGLAVTTAALFAQTAFLFESAPYGFNVIYRSHDIRKFVTSFFTQPFFSDGLYGVIPFLSGYLTYKMVKRSETFDPVIAMIRKHWNWASALLYAISLDLMFPVLSQGPLFAKASKQVINKCNQTWYHHVFHYANTHKSEDQCAPHMTFISVLFQLFPFGLFFSWLLIKVPSVGVRSTCIALLLSILTTYYNSQKLESPVLFDSEMNREWTSNYLQTILHSLSGNAVNYLIGMLCSHMLPHAVTFILTQFPKPSAIIRSFTPFLPTGSLTGRTLRWNSVNDFCTVRQCPS